MVGWLYVKLELPFVQLNNLADVFLTFLDGHKDLHFQVGVFYKLTDWDTFVWIILQQLVQELNAF